MNKKKLKTDDELLEKEGWQIVCQSPFEIENGEGGFARYQPAKVFIDALRYGIRYGKSKDEKLAKKARKAVDEYNWGRLTDDDLMREMLDLFKHK